jgi:His/Glu/Gln/Arg/opine family amino acid ABC transporter permease subunit
VNEFLQRLPSVLQYVLGGIPITLEYTFLSSFGGICLGLVFALMKVSKRLFFRRSAQLYTSFFRGTPMLVQLSIIYFGAPSLMSYKISPLMAGVIAFSLNSGAYVSEIVRAGIQSIDKGQFEAAKALGISHFAMMRDIILPQSLRNILPALVNEVVNVLKETALISTIGEEDIMRRAQLLAAETYSYFEPLLMAAFCYYILVMILSGFAKMLEKRLSYDHRS